MLAFMQLNTEKMIRTIAQLEQKVILSCRISMFPSNFKFNYISVALFSNDLSRFSNEFDNSQVKPSPIQPE